jgi:plasmid stabilization system protein ParE
MTYRVEIAEAAEAEAEAAFLFIARSDPDRAGRWYAGLLSAIASLAEFPTRCGLARENEFFPVEVRQLLYGRRQSVYRVLFTVIGDLDEPVVRVLHIRHAAQRTLGTPESSEES